MRKWGAWGAGMVLLLGMGPALAGPPGDGADPTDVRPPAQGTGGVQWAHWLGGGGGGSAPAAPETPPPLHQGVQKKESGENAAIPRGPTQVEAAAVVRVREEATFMRRSEVILKLQEIADRANDAALRRRVKQLEDRAWAIYLERTRGLPSGQQGYPSDRKILEKHLGGPASTPERRGEEALYQVQSQEGRSTAQEGP